MAGFPNTLTLTPNITLTITRIVTATLLITLISGSAHYYLWRRLVRDAALSPRWHQVLTFLLLALLLSQPLVFILARGLPREISAPFAFLAFTWMGLFSTYLILALGTDLFKSVVRGFQRGVRRRTSEKIDAPENPNRRTTLGRIFAGGVVSAGTAFGGAAVLQVARGFDLVQVEITLEKLPVEFDGFRIVQVSDIHVGPTIGRDFIRHMVDTANEQKPDLIAITGDLVDGSVQNLGRHTQPLGDLRAKHGVYFVTGNHEYYSGADEWIEELSRLGIPTLRNEAVKLRKGEAIVVLAGVTDHRAAEFGDGPNLAHALRNRLPEEEVILLAHQPREIDQAEKHDVGLQLSGHTHGGQFWPWNWVVYLVQPVVSGLARFGRPQIYVHTGTGYWGPPMRAGTRSEMTLVTLRSAQA